MSLFDCALWCGVNFGLGFGANGAWRAWRLRRHQRRWQLEKAKAVADKRCAYCGASKPSGKGNVCEDCGKYLAQNAAAPSDWPREAS